MSSLASFCNQTPYGHWKGEFVRNDVLLITSENMKKYLAHSLAKTRFFIDGMDHLFTEYAIREGYASNDAKSLWNMIGTVLQQNIGMNVDDQTTRNNILQAIGSASVDINRIIQLCFKFRKLCSKLVRLNANYDEKNRRYLIGVLGELVAYLYAVDISNYDCIHHKLVPDNDSAFRHGMDLLGVKFGRTESQDEVCFIEAKATESTITSQRDEIIGWFNEELITKINTMADQAKRNWKNECPTKYERAGRALARIQVSFEDIASCNAKCLSSILIDNGQTITDQQILGYKRVKFLQKELILIKGTSIYQLSKEIFELACTT